MHIAHVDSDKRTRDALDRMRRSTTRQRKASVQHAGVQRNQARRKAHSQRKALSETVSVSSCFVNLITPRRYQCLTHQPACPPHPNTRTRALPCHAVHATRTPTSFPKADGSWYQRPATSPRWHPPRFIWPCSMLFASNTVSSLNPP